MFVIPVVQLLAWCISKPMTMLFDPFEALVLFFAVLIVNQTLADGRSNWMEGAVLMLLYLLIAIAFWCKCPKAQGRQALSPPLAGSDGTTIADATPRLRPRRAVHRVPVVRGVGG